MKGGPGTADPERIHYVGVSLMNIITRAFGVYGDQVSGPDWLISSFYSVDAVLPPGTSKKEFEQMLRNLLTERFELVVSRTQRNMAVYDLIQAKGGSKLRPSSVREPLNEGDAQPPVAAAKTDANGCPMIGSDKPGNAGSSVGGNACSTFHGYTIANFLPPLEMMLAFETGTFFNGQASQAHVVDKTGLTGAFDFSLMYNVGARIPGSATATKEPDDPGLFKVLEKQLGLKLEKSSARLDVLVIKHCNKQPSLN